ncbi:MAG: outer membrane beta-barrel protein [Desulfobacterales bacterium]
MKKNIFISFLVVSCLVFSTAGAAAQERESTLIFGNLVVTPGLALQEVYDDNIYLGSGTNSTTESEESDWITHIIPNIMLDYSLHERGGIKLGYLGNFAYYKYDSNNDWKNHKGIFGLDYKAPSGLIVGIDNLYTRAQDPYSSDNEYKLGVPQAKRWHNDLKTRIGYELQNQFRMLAYYNYYKQKYDDEIDFSQNYDRNEVGAGIEKKILPLTWGFLRYFHGETDYYTHREGLTNSNDADFTYNSVKMGLAWDPGAKIEGELNFGYTWKKYDNDADVSGNQYDDSDTWIASSILSYKPAVTTTFGLAITKAMRDAGADTTEYFDDTGISINVKQGILSELSLLVGAAYSTHGYKDSIANSGRKDHNYKVRLGIEYFINDWLMAGVDYTYREKDSNYVDSDYKDNMLQVTLGLTY